MAQYDGSIRILTKISTDMAEKSLGTLSQTIKGTAKEISSLRSKMDALKGQKFYTDDYKELQSDLSVAQKKLAELVEKQNEWEKNGVTSGGAWDTLNEEIAKASDNVDVIKEKMYQLEEAGKDFAMGEDTQEYANYERQLQYEEEALRKAQELQAVAQRTGDPYGRLSESLSNLSSSLSKILHPIQAAKASFSSMVENAKAKLAGLAASIVNGIANPLQTMKSIAGKTISGTTKLLSGMASVAKKTGSAIKSMASHFLHIGKGSKTASSGVSSVGKGFKTMLKYGLGIRSLYMLFNKLRNAIKEGFGNLAQVSEPVNASLSSLKSSLTQLKNSLATAFAPILTAIAPALTTFINMVSKAVTYVGMLIAALTGQKTFTKATAVQEDYAASLKDTSKNAKEAKKYLSGLDEVAQYNSGENSDSGTGEYKAPTPSEMFETVPIDSSINEIAEKIKNLIRSEDWEGLGEYIANGLNLVIEKIRQAISWENVGPQVTYFVNAFTTSLNSLVDNLDWDLLGRTIGEGINTVVNTLNLLITGIDWANLGAKFAEGINGLFDEVDWENLGELLGNKFMIAWDFLSGVVSNLDYTSIGKSVGDGLNGVFNAIDFTTIAYTLVTGLNGLAQLLQEFSAQVNWDRISENITNGLNTLIQNVNWGDLGESLGKLFSDLLHTLNRIIAETDWLRLGAGLIQGINGTIRGIDWSEAGELLGNSFKGILDFLIGAVQEIDWELLGSSIADFLAGIDWGGVVGKVFELLGSAFGKLAELGAYIGKAISDAFNGIGKYFDGKIKECGGDIVLGIFKGIGDAISGVGKWIYEHIFKPFIDGFKNAFDIHSPSKIMSEQGGFIISGLLDGLKNSISSVLDWLKNIPAWFGEKFKEAYELAKKAFSGIGNFFAGIWEGIKKPFSNIAGWFKDKFSTAWQAVKNVFSSGGKIFDGIKDGILDGLKAVINALIDGINTVIAIPFNGINGALGAIRDVSIAGFKPFDWMPTIDVPQIPKLATGAVIPANREFLAVLGDQKRGTNIETPEALMRKVFQEELRNGLKGIQMQGSGGTYNFNAHINRRVLFEEIINEAMLRQTVSGRNPFELT